MITLILLICLIRALRFKPEEREVKVVEPISYDKEKAVKDLQEMVTCKTISNANFELEDDAEFTQFAQGEVKKVKVYGEERYVDYDSRKRIGIAISKLGASKAVSVGAYAFALSELDKR